MTVAIAGPSRVLDLLRHSSAVSFRDRFHSPSSRSQGPDFDTGENASQYKRPTQSIRPMSSALVGRLLRTRDYVTFAAFFQDDFHRFFTGGLESGIGHVIESICTRPPTCRRS